MFIMTDNITHRRSALHGARTIVKGVLNVLARRIICIVMFLLQKKYPNRRQTTVMYALTNATTAGATKTVQAALINMKTGHICGKRSVLLDAKKDVLTVGAATVKNKGCSVALFRNRVIVKIAVFSRIAMTTVINAQTITLKEITCRLHHVTRTAWRIVVTALTAIVRWIKLIAIGGNNFRRMGVSL